LPSRFPYQRIVDELWASILEGRLAGGERLPSENELAERYRTSRPTVRRAIALLTAEAWSTRSGAVVRSSGRSRMCGCWMSRENFRRHRRAGRSGFNAQVEEQGQTPDQRLLEVGWVKAPREVGLRLDVDDETRVVVRRRLSVVNGEPVAFCHSYYPPDVAEGTPLAEPERIAGGADGLIVDPDGPIGRRLKRSFDNLECRMPTPEELEKLKLGPGVPVLRTLRTVYDVQDRAVKVQDTVAAADKHRFRYEVRMR
jgi:GntR family transcriptional regulator